MAKRRSNRQGDAGRKERPVEIPMTDLGWSEDESEREGEEAATRDIHAAGTPGGGAASGGLAGTNVGDGSPDNVDLEDALGSGVLDNEGEDKDQPPYAGSAGGAVGGTPAEKRAKGGHLRPQPRKSKTHRGDSTIGSLPSE